MDKPQMHQLLAVLPSLKGAAEKIKAETAKVFAGKHHLFEGLAKAYKPLKEEDEYIAASLGEERPLPETIGGKLAHFAEHFIPYMDAEYQRDRSNLSSIAALEINGKTFTGVPATFLLQMKKQLAEIRGVYDAIPTLDMKVDWATDPDKGKGAWVSPLTETVKTEKKKVHKIITESTEHQQAIIDAWTEDIPIGKFEIRHWSGMITPEQKYRVLKRIDGLLAQVTKAVAKANRVEQDTEKIGEELFKYINGDLVE